MLGQFRIQLATPRKPALREDGDNRLGGLITSIVLRPIALFRAYSFFDDLRPDVSQPLLAGA